MKWYVNFISIWTGEQICRCFEENEEEARFFATQVNGKVYYGY